MSGKGIKRRMEARELATVARKLAEGMDDQTAAEAIRSLADAVRLLAKDCAQLEATGNARVRE